MKYQLQAKNLEKFKIDFMKNLNYSTSINDIFIKMSADYYKKHPNHILKFQRFSDITFYRVIQNILFILQFFDGPLWGFGKNSSRKYISSTILFTRLRFQENFSCIFLDIQQNV